MNNKEQLDFKRRSFLKLSGLLGIGTVASTLLPAQNAEALWFNKKEYKVSTTRLAMGTFVSITAIHSSRDEAEQIIGEAFAEIDRLNLLLTRFDENSPVSELNNKGIIKEVPLEVSELIGRSLYHHQATGGAFDITVKPLIDLYKGSFANNIEPGDADIDKVLKRVGSKHIKFRDGQLLFAQEEMGITLDGIAKGYIVDKVSELLSRGGIENHLINAGGDIRTSGAPSKGRNWTVAIQDPAKKKEFPDVIQMTSGAVATSGNYEVYFDQEKLFHHIVDGASGLSPQLSSSVTVTAPTVMDADALSTAVFVMGPIHGPRFIETQMESECFIISKDGGINKTGGWPA